MKKVLIGLLFGLCVFLGVEAPVAAAANVYYVLPDSFVIDAADGIPMVSVENMAGGYRVGIVFKADYSHVRAHIYKAHADDLSSVQIVELSVAARDFSFIGTFIEDNPAVVRKVEREYFGNTMRLQIDLTTDLTKNQVVDLFRFNVVYGLVRAEVQCAGTSNALCGKTLNAIPAYNQFKLMDDAASTAAARDFLALNDYKNALVYGPNAPVYDAAQIDAAARAACAAGPDDYVARICAMIAQHDPGKSLIGAVKSLAHAVFPADVVDQDAFEGYIIGRSAFFTEEPQITAPATTLNVHMDDLDEMKALADSNRYHFSYLLICERSDVEGLMRFKATYAGGVLTFLIGDYLERAKGCVLEVRGDKDPVNPDMPGAKVVWSGQANGVVDAGLYFASSSAEVVGGDFTAPFNVLSLFSFSAANP